MPRRRRPGSPERRDRRQVLAAALVSVTALLVAAGCTAGSGAGGGKAPGSPTTSGAPSGSSPTPKASPEAALDALLAAEQRGDHASSYLLLSTPSRQELKGLDGWIRRRRQLPAITGFTVERRAAGDDAVAVVSHPPGLDPFVGLSAAMERQTWKGRREQGGFLLDAAPVTTPVLPPDGAARSAALAWAQAVQACDEPRGRALQAVPELFGSSVGASSLCQSKGEVAVGDVGRLPPGPASADIVSQYSTDALNWARTVVVTAPVKPFHVILAPIGDSWKIVGIFD